MDDYEMTNLPVGVPQFDPEANGWVPLVSKGFIELVGPFWKHPDKEIGLSGSSPSDGTKTCAALSRAACWRP